jgi:hypothetical protein
VIERRLFIHEAGSIVDKAKPENQAAVQAVADALKGSYLRYTGWLLAIAFVVLVIALITGPYPWAVTFRGWVRDLYRAAMGAAKGADSSAAGEWVAAHRDALLMGIAAVFVLLLLVLSVDWVGFLLLAALAGALAFGVWRIGSETAEPSTDQAA